MPSAVTSSAFPRPLATPGRKKARASGPGMARTTARTAAKASVRRVRLPWAPACASAAATCSRRERRCPTMPAASSLPRWRDSAARAPASSPPPARGAAPPMRARTHCTARMRISSEHLNRGRAIKKASLCSSGSTCAARTRGHRSRSVRRANNAASATPSPRAAGTLTWNGRASPALALAAAADSTSSVRGIKGYSRHCRSPAARTDSSASRTEQMASVRAAGSSFVSKRRRQWGCSRLKVASNSSEPGRAAPRPPGISSSSPINPRPQKLLPTWGRGPRVVGSGWRDPKEGEGCHEFD
mmetsp:Transcript_61683/g.195156  ORF Transcript_61683/g.195156 Transcript_61683/m.195156 type:complete len:300 (+) Transcript_61683:336-1235(+)